MTGAELEPGHDPTQEPARRVSAGDRRQQYLAAAAGLAISQGVDAVTMEGVATGVGVNKALLYRQFANRGELLLALYQREMAELDRHVVKAVQGQKTLEDKMRAWVHSWFEYMLHHGQLLSRLQEARTVARQVERPHRTRQQRIHARYGEWYAQELGLPAEVGRDAAAIIVSALGGVIERWTEVPTAATRERLERTYLEMVLGGLERLARAHEGGDGGFGGNEDAGGPVMEPVDRLRNKQAWGSDSGRGR